MKVLFIGGTGLISSAVSALAVARGIDLTLLHRGGDSHPDGARLIAADHRDGAAVGRALEGLSFDVVVNWITYTPGQAAADIERFIGKTGHYVFISSASVYQKPPVHHVTSESTPLANPFWQYSRDKIACEEVYLRAWREEGFPLTIVRPSLTYGPKQIPAAFSSWERPWTLVDRMRRGQEVIVPGDGSSLWTMTHNSDFARAFLGLLGDIHAIGHAFGITGDEVLTWDQVYALIGAAAGVKPRIVHISSDFIVAADPSWKGGLLGDKSHSALFDTSKIKALVPGFASTIPFAQGIRETIAWFEAHPERCGIDSGFNELSDRLLRANAAGLRALET